MTTPREGQKRKYCYMCKTDITGRKNSRCSACEAIYHSEYRSTHRVKTRKIMRDFRIRHKDRLRQEAIQRRKDKIASMSPEELAVFRQKETDKTKRLYAERKDAVFMAYGGYRCACCGETEKSFLTIDHMNNDGAKMRKEGTHNHTSKLYRWLKDHGYPKGYQVLCMNCQVGKLRNNGICPHQATRNDYPVAGVGSSDPKRSAPIRIYPKSRLGDDIVCSVR